MDNQLLPDLAINSLFYEVVNSLKKGQAKRVTDLAKYAISQYCLRYGCADHHFDLFEAGFIDKYVSNESLVEGDVDDFSAERKGLKKIYEDMFSNPLSDDVNIYTLKDYHRLLFSATPYPEAAGNYRTAPATLGGRCVNLYAWEDIPRALAEADKELKCILLESRDVFGGNEPEKLFDYINRCVRFKCDLIQIHPFFDGNGRTIRALLNKLFILGGLPPVYVHSTESKVYCDALKEAEGKQSYDSIYEFYYIKICQSIYELCLNPTDELRRISDKRVIKRTVENYKNFGLKEDCSFGEMSEYYADNIGRDLLELNILSTKYSLCKMFNTEDDYAYLIACTQDCKGPNVLIDPVFPILMRERVIPFPQDKSRDDRMFLIDLYQHGCATADTHQFGLYLEMLGNGNVSKENGRQKVFK